MRPDLTYVEVCEERAAAYVDPVTGKAGLTYAELMAAKAAREAEEGEE